ncbi:MAG TPA: hypothetical protein DCM86_16525 [Verrucomicrobiales bacterium]|nr:hypothetical protein [Verrucomicrobiales bacterium]
MTKLIVQGEMGGEFELATGKHRIGRSPHSHIQINHPSVSQIHCELSVDPLAVIVSDLGSTNGTFIDGQPITKAELMNGQVLHVGHVAVILQRDIYDVVVPDLPEAVPDRATELADGTPCCFHHETLAAQMRCMTCSRLFCGACVQGIGVVGGRRHYLCPVCHNHCAPYEWEGRNGGRRWLGGLVTSIKKMTVRFLKPPRAEERPGRRG